MNLFVAIFSHLPSFILGLVASLTLLYFVIFFRKFRIASQGIYHVISGLEESSGTLKGQDPKKIDSLFVNQYQLNIWKEYSSTLHPMQVGIDDSKPQIEYRSSLPANMMFTHTSLVDVPLMDDFWRHLPGILTGLGIIGTFSGLLNGLEKFRTSISANSTNLNAGLDPLLESVIHAFTVSAGAIYCAMLVVFFSRLLVARLNTKVERLCNLIDSLYQQGIGEEYMKQLVETFKNSELHMTQLKSALIDDLTLLINNMVDRQTQSQMTLFKNLKDTV